MFKIICNLKLHFQSAFLTKAQAQLRSNLIVKDQIMYNYYLSLHKGESYDGLAHISFLVKQPQKHQQKYLRIDFAGKQVKNIIINSNNIDIKETTLQNGSINIPFQYIRELNTLMIEYSNLYDNDGNGCVSFIDVDSKQYLYTQFQPYFANRVFPLFDQPDLKAKMKLNIVCPSEWQTVLSNQFSTNIDHTTNQDQFSQFFAETYKPKLQLFSQYQKKIPNTYKLTSFKSTTLLPSYLYCFVVGPYKELALNIQKDEAEYSVRSRIPMRLYSIESLYPQLQALAPYIEQITVKSMMFFEKYFGYKYPFSKYDQIFAHEYKWGAMENAGIVTLNDLYLFKDKVSTEKLLSFGNTVVHQLAHHWFGNLVTMKWWDDLWLNQSFAQYISHFCLEKIKNNHLKTIDFESAMLSFFNRKSWGYADDELVTTHPIRSEVQNTHIAESIFDGITYSKGAAIMKQLMYLLGQDHFSSALNQYFKKYAFSNAVLDDLLDSISPYFKQLDISVSLDQWKRMWLETAGTNILKCIWKAGQKEITIQQSVDRKDCPTLRIHKIKIAMFQRNHEIVEQQILVLPKAITTVSLEIPESTVAILLNYQDLTFAKIQLDEKSLEYFGTHLKEIKDSLSRAIIWKTFFNMIKDCKITAQLYTKFVIDNLGAQVSDPIFEEQLTYLWTSITNYTPYRYRDQLYHKSACFLKELLPNSSVNRKVIIKDKFIDFCHSEEMKKELCSWYSSTHLNLKAEDLNITLRWKIIIKLFSCQSLSVEQKWKYFEDMKSKDSSDTMVNRQLTCSALIADEAALDEMYQNYFNHSSKLSIMNAIHQMKGFNHEVHYQLWKNKFADKYFEDIQRFLSNRISQSERWFSQGDYLENFITYLDPVLEKDIQELREKIKRFEKIEVNNNDKIKRNILKKIDLLKRRVKAYEFYDCSAKS